MCVFYKTFLPTKNIPRDQGKKSKNIPKYILGIN